MSRPTLGFTQPSVQRVPEPVSRGLKRQKHEAGRLSPCIAEVENGGAIPAGSHTSSWLGA
jgi:hypothetical protein